MMRLVILGLSLAAGVAAQIPATVQSPEPGTYRVWMCAAPCTPADSAKAVATATIVILDDTSAAAEPARAALAALPPLAHWRRNVARGALHRNAYFAATRLGPPDPAQCK